MNAGHILLFNGLWSSERSITMYVVHVQVRPSEKSSTTNAER